MISSRLLCKKTSNEYKTVCCRNVIWLNFTYSRKMEVKDKFNQKKEKIKEDFPIHLFIAVKVFSARIHIWVSTISFSNSTEPIHRFKSKRKLLLRHNLSHQGLELQTVDQLQLAGVQRSRMQPLLRIIHSNTFHPMPPISLVYMGK